MKSIKRRFERIQKEIPGLSSHWYFRQAVSGQNFTPQTVARKFNELVEKDDYENAIKKELLAEIYTLSEYPHDNEKQR